MTGEAAPGFDDDNYTMMNGPVRIMPAVDPETKLLLIGFENLGQDCEFGLLQRRFQAEPLGLLRWSNATIEALIDMLNADFAGFGDESRTILNVTRWNELSIIDPKYRIYSHTFVCADGVDKEKFAQKQRSIRKFLARNLLEQLREASKIFVYKSKCHVNPLQIERLYEAITRHNSENSLLFVQPPDEGNETVYGDLYHHRDHLYSVRIPSGANLNGGWNISFDQWVAACRALKQALYHSPLTATHTKTQRA